MTPPATSLYGDYLLYDREDHDQPFVITAGFSKAHRPDLKQIVHSLLCVDHLARNQQRVTEWVNR